jgi:hypothetical protein
MAVTYFELTSRYLPLRKEGNQEASQKSRIGATVCTWGDLPAMKRECYIFDRDAQWNVQCSTAQSVSYRPHSS